MQLVTSICRRLVERIVKTTNKSLTIKSRWRSRTPTLTQRNSVFVLLLNVLFEVIQTPFRFLLLPHTNTLDQPDMRQANPYQLARETALGIFLLQDLTLLFLHILNAFRNTTLPLIKFPYLFFKLLSKSVHMLHSLNDVTLEQLHVLLVHRLKRRLQLAYQPLNTTPQLLYLGINRLSLSLQLVATLCQTIITTYLNTFQLFFISLATRYTTQRLLKLIHSLLHNLPILNFRVLISHKFLQSRSQLSPVFITNF